MAFPLAVNVFVGDLLPSSEWKIIILVSVGLLALYILNMVLMYIVNYWGHVLGINIETDMRLKLFIHIQKLKDADRIVVVKEDGITEEGRHEELVAAGGIYSRLHQAQYGGRS